MKNRKNVNADEVRGKERAGGACARLRGLIGFACACIMMNRCCLYLGGAVSEVGAKQRKTISFLHIVIYESVQSRSLYTGLIYSQD